MPDNPIDDETIHTELKRKDELEAALRDERLAVASGSLKDDNPLDTSKEFQELCEACRRGDLKVAQEKINQGINVNSRDEYDYTPLILASLCGHYSLVQLLLDSNALCERDTFQGERCLYNALNDDIRNLLLAYDYSKSRDPLQPLASHVTSLLHRDVPDTSDISLVAGDATFRLHKFVLSARSPYFRRKLASVPDTRKWRAPPAVPAAAAEVVVHGLYFSEAYNGSIDSHELAADLDKLARQLEVESILDNALEQDRRLQRQKQSAETSKGRDQLRGWFEENVLGQKLVVDRGNVDDIKYDRQNAVFSDVLLCAEEDDDNEDEDDNDDNEVMIEQNEENTPASVGIPVGHFRNEGSPTRHSPHDDVEASARTNPHRTSATATLFPAHRAMLLRAEYFNVMFSSAFAEAQPSAYLPIIRVDCGAEVLAIILRYLYTEEAVFGLDVAMDVLFAADQLFLESLKTKAATVISGLGSGEKGAAIARPSGTTSMNASAGAVDATAHERENGDIVASDATALLHIPTVLRAAWQTRTPRLETFAARYIADRLEWYLDGAELRALVRESAARIAARQETDTVELVDDIRYYLSERFKLRMEDVDLDELLGEQEPVHRELPPALPTGGADGVDARAGDGDDTTAQVIRTLDGLDVDDDDELARSARMYRELLARLDALLDELQLDV